MMEISLKLRVPFWGSSMMEVSLKLRVPFWGSSKNDGDFPKIKGTFLAVF